MIAVHCGAGKHGEKHYTSYKRLCNRACRMGMEVLQKGGTALEAVKAAVIVLENDPLTNAGYGSNLTITGDVECDAAVMDGDTLLYGGCGSVKKVKNPIALAYDICIKQLDEQPLGLIPPSLLVGNGALRHAKLAGLRTVKSKDLISARALRQLQKYNKYLDNAKLDTVGAVCCDKEGRVASACSSGGLLLKRPGRVGQAALYGSGVWADNYSKDTEPSVAVCTTGCGEHLVQTQLAKVISSDLKSCSCPITALSKSMTDNFINSRYLHRVDNKNAGALVLHTQKGENTLLWGHSTESMSIGYMRYSDSKPKSIISLLPNGTTVGKSVMVGGCNFYTA